MSYETFTKHVFLFLSKNNSILRAFQQFIMTKHMAKLTFTFLNKNSNFRIVLGPQKSRGDSPEMS